MAQVIVGNDRQTPKLCQKIKAHQSLPRLASNTDIEVTTES